MRARAIGLEEKILEFWKSLISCMIEPRCLSVRFGLFQFWEELLNNLDLLCFFYKISSHQKSYFFGVKSQTNKASYQCMRQKVGHTEEDWSTGEDQTFSLSLSLAISFYSSFFLFTFSLFGEGVLLLWCLDKRSTDFKLWKKSGTCPQLLDIFAPDPFYLGLLTEVCLSSFNCPCSVWSLLEPSATIHDHFYKMLKS